MIPQNMFSLALDDLLVSWILKVFFKSVIPEILLAGWDLLILDLIPFRKPWPAG